MNPPKTNSRAGSAPTLRTHYLALLTPLVLTHALQSAGGLLDGFWLGRLLGVRGIATAASFFPVFFLLLSLNIGWAPARKRPANPILAPLLAPC